MKESFMGEEPSKPNNIIKPLKCFCVKNRTGIIAITITYTLMVFLYFVTVYYGIFNCTFG